MKNKILYICIALGLLVFASCSDFGNINDDPNNPTQDDTRYLFLRAMQGVTAPVYTSAPAPSSSTYDPWSQLYPQYFSERRNIQYTQFNIVDFNLGLYYNTFLKNLNLIIAMNQDEKLKYGETVKNMGPNMNQIGVAMTLKAFYFMHMTDVVGMIPYFESNKGDEGNFTPKYDSQKDIYTDLDKQLNEAYAMMDASKSLSKSYDILYNGNVGKWKKLNATLRMMMAIKLSDVDPATGKVRFEKAYKDGGLKNNSDNLIYRYLSENDNMNPLYANMVVDARKDFAPSKTIIDALLERKDPRALSYGNPNAKGKYDAVPFGVPRAEIKNYTNVTVTLNPKLYAQNAPIVVISATRSLLIEAEAAVRGWISADANSIYKNAIEQSFAEKDFASDINRYKTSDPDLLASLMSDYGFITDIDAYLAQPNVALSGTNTEKIEKIAMQRWLGGFNQDGIEAWSDWRRLNVPKLDPGKASRLTHVPYRRQYYLADYETNMDNYKAALSVQGADNFDTRVWWDVADN